MNSNKAPQPKKNSSKKRQVKPFPIDLFASIGTARDLLEYEGGRDVIPNLWDNPAKVAVY